MALRERVAFARQSVTSIGASASAGSSRRKTASMRSESATRSKSSPCRAALDSGNPPFSRLLMPVLRCTPGRRARAARSVAETTESHYKICNFDVNERRGCACSGEQQAKNGFRRGPELVHVVPARGGGGTEDLPDPAR